MGKITCPTYNKSLEFNKGVRSFVNSLSSLYELPKDLLDNLYNKSDLDYNILTDLLIKSLSKQGVNIERTTPAHRLVFNNNNPLFKSGNKLYLDTLNINSISELNSLLKEYVSEVEKSTINFSAGVFGTLDDPNTSFDEMFENTKSKINTTVKTKSPKVSRKPVFYAAPGLGKTYLTNLNKLGEYVDADEVAVKIIKEILNDDVTPVEASGILGKNSIIRAKFQERIKELNKTKTILSSMDSSKLGIAYDKYYTPSEEILDTIIENLSSRAAFPFSITKEKYKELYIDKYPNTIRVDKTLAEVFGNEEQEYISSLSSYLLTKISDLPLTFSRDKVAKGQKKITSRAYKYRSGFYLWDGKHYSVYSLTGEPMSFEDTLTYLKDIGYLSEDNPREEYFKLFGVKEDELDTTNDNFQHYINWVNGIGKRYTYSISPVSSLFSLESGSSETLNEDNIEEATAKLMKLKITERLNERISDLYKALRNALTINNEDSLIVQSIKAKLELYKSYKQELRDNPEIDLIELMLENLIGYEIKSYSDVEFITQEHLYLKSLMDLEGIEPSEKKLKLLNLLQEYINKENIIQSAKVFKEEYNKDFDAITPIDDINVIKKMFISFRESKNEILQLIGKTVNKGISEIQDMVNKFRKEHDRLKENLKKYAPEAIKDQSWLIDKKTGTFYTQYEKGIFHKIKEAKDGFDFSELSRIVNITLDVDLATIKTKRGEIVKDYYDNVIIALKTELDTLDKSTLNRIINSTSNKNLKSELKHLISQISDFSNLSETDLTKIEEIKFKIIQGKEIESQNNLNQDLDRVEKIYNAVASGTLSSIISDPAIEKVFFRINKYFKQEIKDQYLTNEYKDIINDTSQAGKAKREYYNFFTEYIRSAEVTEKLAYGLLPSYRVTQDVRNIGSVIDNAKRSFQEREDKVIHTYNKVTGAIEQNFAIQGLNRLPVEDMDLDMFSVLEKFSESLSNAIVRNKYRDQLFAAKSLLKQQVGTRRDKWGKLMNVDNDDKQLTTAISAADSVMESFLYGMYKDVDGVLSSGKLNKKDENRLKELRQDFDALSLTTEEKERISKVNKGATIELSDRENKGLNLFKSITLIQEGTDAITGRKLTDSLLSFTTLLRLGFSPLGFISESMQAFMGALVEGKGSIIKLNDITDYLKIKFLGSNKEFTEKMEWLNKQFVMDSFLKGGIENNKFMEQALFFYKLPNDIFNGAYLYSYMKNKKYNGIPLWDLIEKNGDEFKWKKESNMIENDNYTENKYTYQEEFRLILRKTRERQQSTDPIESNKKAWGRLLNQFKGSWLYEGFHYRYGKGTEVYLGKVDGVQQFRNTEGYYRTTYNTLSSAKKSSFNLLGDETEEEVKVFNRLFKTGKSLLKIALFDKVMGNDYNTEYNIPEKDRDNIEKAISDIRIKLVVGLMLTLMLILGGDDKEKKKGTIAYKFLFNNLVRLNGDATIYSSPASFMNTIKNAIPALTTVRQVYTLFVTDSYKTIIGDPTYYEGTKRETLRYYSDLKKLIPIVTTYENLEQFLTEKSKNY